MTRGRGPAIGAAAALAAVAACAPYGAVVVGGRSMAPALETGDLVVYAEREDPRPGDVAVFRDAEGGLVAHRVVRTTHRGDLLTRGDANPCEDLDTVDAGRVAGPVRAVVPLGRLWRGVLLAGAGRGS